tara:strand:+ start:4361 stop:6532 length:2172 start_codon:yes stop_codon:yes gene_type:complete
MAEKTLSIRLGLNDKQFQSALRGVTKSIKQLPGQMKQVGSSMTRSLTLPLAALGAGTIKLASDFEETNAKFNTVFSSMQGKANETAKNLQQNFGLSGRAAKQLLGDTGDLLVGFGFQEEAALNLSDQVNRLAVDLASFTNFEGGAEGASKALTKALLGETESAKSLGIVIRQNTAEYKERIAAIQAEQGVSEKQAKAMANLQIATEQSGKAIGDFSRTSGSFANQSRILKANLEDVGVELGQALLPIAMKAVGFFQKLVGAIKSASPEAKRIAVTIGILVAALGPALSLIGSLATAFALLTSPVGIAIAAITAIVAAFLFVRENYDAFAERLGDWSWWKNAILEAIKFLIEFNPLNLVIDGFNGILEFFGKNTIPNPFEAMQEGIDDLKVETKEYENEFGSFTDAIKNQATEAAGALNLLGGSMGVGTGGFVGGGSTASLGGGGSTASSGGRRFTPQQAPAAVDTIGLGFEKIEEPKLTFADTLKNQITEAKPLVATLFDTIEEGTNATNESAILTSLNFDVMIEKMQGGLSKFSEVGGKVFSAFNGLIQASFKKRNQELDNYYKRELENINNSKRTEEQKASAILTLDEDVAEKRKAIMKKEARMEKAQAIMSATISTAAAVAAALPNIPLSIIIGGLGAGQIATIVATPLPTLAQGGLAFGPTQAIVGDNFGAGVNPEVIAPLDKLKGMLSMETVNVVGTISGEDIVLASDRFKTRSNRSF